MDHPLLSSTQTPLRKRMVHFLKTALAVQRSSNIVFLCGGNESTHMRTYFKNYCEQHLPDYEIFLPEAAMGTVFSDELLEPFDLADFEELVGAISYAIVIFPEAPGSYAETGYFSATPTLSQKCILVMDYNRQHHDSFISLGPAKKISETSKFYPTINLNYSKPNFNTIIERITSRRKHTYRKTLSVDKFSNLSAYELAALLHTLVRFCKIATTDDIQFFFRAIFSNRFSSSRVQKLISILVGAEYLNIVGNYGHFVNNASKPALATIKDGCKELEDELRLSIATVFQDGDPEFLRLLETVSNVD